MEKGRVLFLYSNSEGYGGVPNGIAVLSACLKQAGFETKCFDTTFMKSPPMDHFQRQKYGGVKNSDASEVWGEWHPGLEKKIPELFSKTIKEFNPDLIAASFAEINYSYGVSLLNPLKKEFAVPVVAGGIFPTLSPEITIDNDAIDMVCIGEGEDALVELALAIVEKSDHSQINNLWVKKDGKIMKNPLQNLRNIDSLPHQDWSIFDQKHFYKPYCGGFVKMAYIELARGCPYKCTYCTQGNMRELLKGKGSYLRKRSIDNALNEACWMKLEWDVEIVFFTDDNFLGMGSERLDYFCNKYEKKVGIPFWIQTRCESIKEDYVKRLKEINISAVAMGIEHGDEEYRRKYMNRKTSNKVIQEAFEILHKYDIRTTANVMIGLPYENETLCKSTLRLLKQIQPKSISMSFYQPFRGTEMFEMAVQEGYLLAGNIISNSNICLNMPQFPRERIMYYYNNFRKFIDGELPVD